MQQKRMACLQAVQIAFSMKGFRAQLLNDAIFGVETFANAWLQIIDPDLSVTLSLGEKYEVKLSLHGAGGGFGYPALSSGERRRVDVAVVLALADMAAQATGTGNGTMWLDEVFDSLDPAGISGVCEALSALSSSRAVVVITHSDELKSRVDAQVNVALSGL
jgi:DNA repair exonuclease SbcCD ATPase subunit